jgi:hypothetical protein
MFNSTADPQAHRPADLDVPRGDVWWRHPCAEQSPGQWRL